MAGAFSKRVCVVTGAGSGIGRAISVEFARQGARVVLLDRNAAGLRETSSIIAGINETAIMIDCDVSDQHRVHDAASEVMSEFGPAEVLVNNAGVLRSGPLASLSVEEWNSLLAINLTGFFLCAQVFGSQMLEQRNGSIVHLSSIGGTHPTANAGAYSVAKAGIIMLSRQLAIEWGALGVRSNVVSPGLIRTPMTEAFYNDPSATEARQSVVPRGRIGTPEDIARAVVFLASPDADYITGQELGVDGGLSRSLLSFIPRSGYERG